MGSRTMDLDMTDGTNYTSYSKVQPENTKKIVVIGKGRFGNACAQGLRDSYIEVGKGEGLLRCSVHHTSATKFMGLQLTDMIDVLFDAEFVVYCGTHLPNYAHKLAKAMKEARKGSAESMEFIDFSNPDPVFERDDVSGTIDIYSALMSLTDDGDRRPTTVVSMAKELDEEEEWDTQIEIDEQKPWKVWKITEVASLDVAGTEGTSMGLVYGDGVSKRELPRLKMPGLLWERAPCEKSDLIGEVYHRLMERAEIDRWYDGFALGIAVFCFTSFYAITRYSKDVNGSEPNEQIVMYLLDKAFAWTGLWMMVVSPYAGNMLALGALYEKFGSLPFMDKCVTLMSTILMIIPCIFISISWALWIFFRNYFFRGAGRGKVNPLYQAQYSPEGFTNNIEGGQAFCHSMLVDMVTLKGETGNVGFFYALVHSFLGFIICDVSYKGYWFLPSGRLGWRFELSMMTGAVSTTLLFCVALRSLFGHASWIRLKPLYAYMSPIGMWFGVVHVMAFGAKGWDTLFNKNYHNGQMSITFVSSMLPACVLLVHHLMGTFGTKKQVSNKTLWKHSMIYIANQDFKDICSKSAVKKFEVERQLPLDMLSLSSRSFRSFKAV